VVLDFCSVWPHTRDEGARGLSGPYGRAINSNLVPQKQKPVEATRSPEKLAEEEKTMTVELTQTDPVARMIEEQVLKGIEAINAVNEVLLAEDSGTPVREIDKALKAETEKDSSDLPKEVLKNYTDAQAAYAKYRDLVEKSRNAYREQVLHEDAKNVSEVSDADKEQARDVYKTVLEAVKFVKSYAQGNGKKDVLAWAESLQVPQVGRAGTASVGAKKPRVFVFIDGADTPKGSLTEASQALSTKDAKVTVSDLTEAWNKSNGGEEGEFTFGEHTLRIQNKPKKSDG
jgi:hypothetical protein